jgi:glycosyltransferase involved in cell wall biosynthesis
MHIAISAAYRMHGGGLVHLRNILESWARMGVDRDHKISLFLRDDSIPILTDSISERIEVHTVGGRLFKLAGKLAWEQSPLVSILKKSRPDVLFCPGNIVPLRCPVPVVSVFHNIGPFCATVTPRSVGAYEWLWFKALGLVMRLSARAATRVIFPSRYFRDLFVERFGLSPDQSDVIYHGGDELKSEPRDAVLLEQLGIRTPYLLSVSHLYPYKNFPALIRGFALAKETLGDREIQLVLVGSARDDSYFRQLQRLVHELGMDDSVLMTGAVPHESVGALLAGCHGFVFQSTCENCPMSLIEALAADVPIACSNVGVMPEIAGDAAAYFDPYDPGDISNTLARVINDAPLRDTLRKKALEQARIFPTWDEVGEMTLRSLERAAVEG